MVTEEQIVYSIIETVKNGEVNQDSRIGERIVRAFLAKYRADIIRKYSMDGYLISDECYQSLYNKYFYKVQKGRNLLFQYTNFPKTIRLKDSFGIFFTKNEENIPILNNEEFYLGLKNKINKRLPKAMLIDNIAFVHIGELTETSCGTFPKNNVLVNDLFEEYNITTVTTKRPYITLDVKLILQNPDDADNYDWTSTPYPLNPELIEKITNDILRVEYNIILQVKNDKVTDGKDQPTE